jgi:hypothetical protein
MYRMFRLMPLVAALFGSESRRIYSSPMSNAVANNCVSFTVGNGTGCAWMCGFCANSLGTNNYYFTDGVCQYQPGGCVGSPVAGEVYSCCSAAY